MSEAEPSLAQRRDAIAMPGLDVLADPAMGSLAQKTVDGSTSSHSSPQRSIAKTPIAEALGILVGQGPGKHSQAI